MRAVFHNKEIFVSVKARVDYMREWRDQLRHVKAWVTS